MLEDAGVKFDEIVKSPRSVILRRGVYPEPQILRRFAPQNDMGEGLLRMTWAKGSSE